MCTVLLLALMLASLLRHQSCDAMFVTVNTLHFDLVALIELAYLLYFRDKPFVESLCPLVVTTLYIGIHDE